MKNNILILSLLLLAATVCAQEKFVIKGNLSKIQQDVKVMLYYDNNNGYTVDSTIAKKGVFTFTGTVAEPVRATLHVKPMQPDTTEMTHEKAVAMDRKDFFLENGTITVTGDKAVKTAAIKGGKTQTDFVALEAVSKNLQGEDLERKLGELIK